MGLVHCAAKESSAPAYRPRQPSQSALFQLVRENLETFLEDGRRRSTHGFGYPRYVEQTFRRFITCGQWGAGFCRLRCESCGHEMLLPFACKTRGFCPSCQGRRMNELSLLLTDHLLPHVPYRQWVFTYPIPLRFRMAADPKLMTAVLQRCIASLFAWQRRQARKLGVTAPMPAALTAIQKFGSAVNLHPHAHTLAPDGVFALNPDDTLRFVPLPQPTEQDIENIASGIARRVARLVAARDEMAFDDDDQRGPLDQAMAEAQPPPRPTGCLPLRPVEAPRCASVDGVTVHAAVTVAAQDRQGLIQLIRYALRPPIAPDRLSRLPDGRYRYRLRRPWYNNAATDIVFLPLALMRRLALLLPHPRQHILRYHGLFAPHATNRSKLAALMPTVATSENLTAERVQAAQTDDAGQTAPVQASRPSRIAWASLLRRVFQADLESCPKCAGPLTLIALMTEHTVIQRFLNHLGLPTALPEPEPVRLAYLAAFDDAFTEAPTPPPPAARGPPPIQWCRLPAN